ncbi:uncharacterized protein PRCAT00005190001 [Priceomyces carsonii]|uniref:uncharacterized protein n=1 Tax=Priceomyces carsonii TaxID=28549 RepID=UPI002EDA9ADD|nr:unnamed protein product [Priceomyces carsonii]
MVAEPVQATILTLTSFYNQASNYLATQHDKLVHSEYYEKIASWDPVLLVKGENYSSMNCRQQPTTLVDRCYTKLKDNKIKVATILTIGIGLTSIYVFADASGLNKYKIACKPKRRVPKLSNGARRDIVLVVGSPTEPLTRLIVLDFEKRGFIVYLTILDEKDFKYIESNPITDDINYLNLNEESNKLGVQLSNFQRLISQPVIPFPGASPHHLRLLSVVFAPNLYFPLGPIENISMSSWNKVFDRLFTYLKLFSSGLVNLVRQQDAKIISIVPSIVSSLEMPYHAPETLFQNSSKHFFTTLTRELNKQGLSVTQVKLGNLNISNGRQSYGRISNIVNSEIRNWDEDMKLLYANDFSKSQLNSTPIRAAGKGSNLRDLYHLLFDLIYSKEVNLPVVYCGAGARIYDWLSVIFPDSLIEWFLV